jgi:hypothetical protein
MILVEENNNTEGGLQERQNTKTYVKHSDSWILNRMKLLFIYFLVYLSKFN